MNDELPMGAQVIVPPGDNEHIMQAAIAAAQAHTIRRRATQYYPQAVATHPSWLFAKVPETWWTKLKKQTRYVLDQVLLFYIEHRGPVDFGIEWGPNLFPRLAARRREGRRAILRRVANN